MKLFLITVLCASLVASFAVGRESNHEPGMRPSSSEIQEARDREAAAAKIASAKAAKLREENEKRLADIAAAQKDREDAAAQRATADKAQKLAVELLEQVKTSTAALAEKQITLDRALQDAAGREQDLTEAEQQQKTTKAELVAQRTEHASEKIGLQNEKAALERDKSAVEIRERIWSAGALGLVLTNVVALFSLLHSRRATKLDAEYKALQIRELRTKLDSPLP